MSLTNRLKLKKSREKFKTEKKHGQSRSIGGRGNRRTEYWNAKTQKWQRTKPAPIPRKVKVEQTKPETIQERIKREGLADWRVDSNEQKKLNINKKKVQVDKPQTKTNKTTSNKTTSNNGRKRIPGEFPGTREEFDKKYGTGDAGKKKTADKDLTIKKDKVKTKTSNQKKEKSQEQIDWEKKTRNSPARKSGKFSDEELWLRHKEHQDWKKRNNRLKIRK